MSPGRSAWKYSAVMSPTTEDDEAWCPPTLVPSGFGRTLLAWWTMSAESHSTRFWMDSSVATEASAMPSERNGSGERIVRRILVPDVLHEPGGMARHYRQRPVDRGRNAGGRHEVAAVDPAGVPLPRNARSLLHHPVPRHLVGG